MSSDEENERVIYPLHDAAEAGDIITLQKHLDAESDHMDYLPDEIKAGINQRDHYSCTPLHLAILHGHLSAMKLLIKSGAKVSMKCEGVPVLHMVLSVGSLNRHCEFALEAVKLLSELVEVDLNVRDADGRTPLHIAAMHNLSDCAKVLIEHGAREATELRDRHSYRPLHLAAKFQSVEMIRLLIETGAQIEAKNSESYTPLHLASHFGCTEGVGALLKAGADAEVKDKRGRTAVDLAERAGFLSVVALLEEHLTKAAAAVAAAATTSEDSLNGLNLPSQSRASADSPRVNRKEKKVEATCILTHPKCFDHLTAASHSRDSPEPPPENRLRIQTLEQESNGILRGAVFERKRVQWIDTSEPAKIADVLRVHDYSYIKKLEAVCQQASKNLNGIALVDADTAVSKDSLDAAFQAAGMVIDAVSRVSSGQNQNAFCITRPPGHHAGPHGMVPSINDPHGSNGFCLLNNVAIGAAYARHVLRGSGITKVAIVDFDVHHGNGTEAIVRGLVPSREISAFTTPICQGQLVSHVYRPWLDESDPQNVLFASIHGYGRKQPEEVRDPWFYPGSGETGAVSLQPTAGDTSAERAPDGATTASEMAEEEETPTIINLGLDHPTLQTPRAHWRSEIRKKLLPQLAKFNPDIILVSAGFDAHNRDIVNWGYLGLVEEDFEWITLQLMKIANLCCEGRVVSVLEGGYRIHGQIVSPFARSVAAHVRTLCSGTREKWSDDDNAWELEFEKSQEDRRKEIAAKKESAPTPKGKRAAGSVSKANSDSLEAKMDSPVAAVTVSQRPKRQRVAVDYAELARKLEEEERAAKKNSLE